MKRLVLLLTLAACAPLNLAATPHQFGGHAWSVSDSPRQGRMTIAAVSGYATDEQHRAAALNYLVSGQRGCAISDGGPVGGGRYGFRYVCG